MTERLQNILAHADVASRRGAAALIESGAVTVDGLVVREPGARFEPTAAICVNGRPVSAEERKRTVVLYKPVGVLSTMSDPFGGRTVAELVKTPERLVPVGRLDRDSEGLLLMSNDGALVNELTHPRFAHRKTYHVKVAGRWSDEKLATLRSPLTLDDGYTIRPVPVDVLEDYGDNTRLLRFVLSEGRKRQIRKMCSAAHLVVLSLARVAVGAFALPPELRPGEWRDLTPDELCMLTSPGAPQDRPRRPCGSRARFMV
ncbi:MAG: rRNA pseudouridine synthase [Kiritimatiellae bacterium]|nr:rRNA pseudouridine synthase [Kiritimatiellia bacterium]